MRYEFNQGGTESMWNNPINGIETWENEYDVTLKLESELVVKCKYKLIRVEKNDAGIYTISGRFTNLSNVDKMTLVQFCMKKNMENINK